MKNFNNKVRPKKQAVEKPEKLKIQRVKPVNKRLLNALAFLFFVHGGFIVAPFLNGFVFYANYPFAFVFAVAGVFMRALNVFEVQRPVVDIPFFIKYSPVAVNELAKDVTLSRNMMAQMNKAFMGFLVKFANDAKHSFNFQVGELFVMSPNAISNFHIKLFLKSPVVWIIEFCFHITSPGYV
jgi:hypothetical protein